MDIQKQNIRDCAWRIGLETIIDSCVQMFVEFGNDDTPYVRRLAINIVNRTPSNEQAVTDTISRFLFLTTEKISAAYERFPCRQPGTTEHDKWKAGVILSGLRAAFPDFEIQPKNAGRPKIDPQFLEAAARRLSEAEASDRRIEVAREQIAQGEAALKRYVDVASAVANPDVSRDTAAKVLEHFAGVPEEQAKEISDAAIKVKHDVHEAFADASDSPSPDSPSTPSWRDLPPLL